MEECMLSKSDDSGKVKQYPSKEWEENQIKLESWVLKKREHNV